MIFLDSARPTGLVIRLLNERFSLRLPIAALVIFIALLFCTILLMAISLTLGSYDISLVQVWNTLLDRSVSDQITIVVWEFRFPRTLVSALVGAMLALSGASLQNVTRNGLADPSLVGISQGAGLAVISLVILWPEYSDQWRSWAAFGGSLGIAGLIMMLSWSNRNGSSIRFILMGIGVAAFISSITSALMTYGQIEQAMSALAWLSGSINSAGWDEVRMLFIWFIALLPLLLGLSRSMAALQMGEATAIGLGASTKWLRIALISVSVGFAAIATAAVGPLGFVGLIAPHAARRISRSGVGMHLMISAAIGAFTVTLADLLGRVLFAPVQIPAGLVTAIIGVPIFVFLLSRSQAKSTI